MVDNSKLSRGFVQLGTTPKGEETKLAKGGEENGPTMRPADHSLSSFVDKTSGCSSALRKLGAKSDLPVPANPMRKPREKPWTKKFLRSGSLVDNKDLR